MALSDWDTLAFDSEGQPSNGVIEGFQGATVEIYKNWLYARDPRWRMEKLEGETLPIATIYEGSINVSEFHVGAIRHSEQAAIFCYVICHRDIYETTPEGNKKWEGFEYRRMAGIGCNGYIDALDKVFAEEKLDPEVWEPYGTGSLHDERGSCLTFSYAKIGAEMNDPDDLVTFERPEGGEYEVKWVGVTAETFKAFIDWLRTADNGKEFKEWLAKVEAAEPLRCNQGDAFFADRGVIDGGVTKIGEAVEPAMMGMIKAMFSEPDGEAQEEADAGKERTP